MDMTGVWFVLLVACGTAASQSAECKSRPGMSPFDGGRFSGEWYVVGESQESGNIPKACIKTHYNVAGENSSTSLEVSMSLATPAVEGDDVWVFSGETFYPGLVGVNRTFFQNEDGVWERIGQLNFLTTDYDQFAIVYSCFDSTDGQGPLRSTFQIWSRNQTLNETVFNTIKVMFIGMDHGIGTRMKVIDNSGC